jgi:macrolide transport system ATP-binding/permease protein
MAFQDVRHACRMFARNPGFTAIAVLSLALGIGANSAIFSLADALLLRPLPIRDPGAVVTIGTAPPDSPYGGVSYANYRDFRDRLRSFDGVAAYTFSTWGVATSAKDAARMRMGLFVSGNFFQVLGVEPALGRGFSRDEGQAPGRDAVVVLSHEFWKTHFAASPSAIGQSIRINGIDFTVVGVAPEKFTGIERYVRPAMFVPLMMKQRLDASKDDPLEKRGDHGLTVKARLRPGASIETARAELATVWRGLQRQYPEENRGRIAAVKTEIQVRYQEYVYDAVMVSFLMGLVALVLIIACANVANLLLARARSRSREIAIRLALGAGRLRLIRQMLLESAMLALMGGLLGIAFAYGGIRFLQGIQIPTDLPVVIGVQLDHRVLLFSLFAALATALLFGLAPALHSTRTDLVPALKAGGQGARGKRRTMGRNALVIGQVALSMALLVAAGMLVDAVRKTATLNPGFRTDHVLTMEFDTALVRYTDAQTRTFYREIRDRARALPGVRSVAMSCYIPFSPNGVVKTVVPEGYQFPKGVESAPIGAAVVDENYFDTMKTAIIRGRGFTAGDKDGARRVAVVNAEFAKTYWPKQDPIGKRFRLNDGQGPWVEVVGLTKTNKYWFIAEPPIQYFYLPFAQEAASRMSLIVETAGDPGAVAAPLREAVRSLDPNQPIYNVRTLSSFYQQRAISTVAMLTQMVAAMGLLGLTLALVGLYGLIAYSVSRRTQEIGIRMAIGATKAEVVRMVLRQGLALVLSGMLAGGAISFALARLLTAALAGLGAPNPITYVVVPVALVLITLAACYIPARRASLIDPIRSLRYE